MKNLKDSVRDAANLKCRLLFLLLAMVCSTQLVCAYKPYDCCIDGIFYRLREGSSGNTAIVNPQRFDYKKGNNTYDGHLVIPKEVTYKGQTYRVTEISSVAYEDCSGLTAVTIPNSVKKIGRGAFNECPNLKKVIIEDGEEELMIETGSFIEKSPVESVYMGRNLRWNSPKSPFADMNRNVSSFEIGPAVTTLTEYIFCGCKGLNSVVIPESVTKIGNNAFENSGLSTITIPESVTEIGEEAFKGCAHLETVTLPNGLPAIGASIFRGCESLRSVNIPSAVTKIEDRTFMNCKALASVTIPNNVKVVGTQAFYSCI